MKLLTVNSEHIAAGLSRVLKAKDGPNTSAILDNVHVKTIAGGMILTHNTIDIAIQTGVQAEVEQEGKEFLLNPQAYTVLQILKAEKADIIFDIEGNTLTLTYADNSLKFTLEKPDEYPGMLQVKASLPTFTATDDTIASLYKCLPYVSKDDLRPSMTGVYFTNKMIVATDAYRLVKITNEIEVKKDFEAVVRPIFINALGTLGENVKMKVSDGRIAANDNNTLIVSTLIDARFPNFQQVIPTETNIEATFFREELKKNIKLATVLSAKSDRRMILDMTADSYTMTGHDADYEQEITLKADCRSTGSIRMAFNGAFLLNMLESIDAEQITLCLTTPKSGALIHDTQILYLIMPLMLDEAEQAAKQAA